MCDYPDYPVGNARPAAIHVPGFRIAADGSSHEAHRDGSFGSACCVYGLTFTSHFYGARRTVGYVPFTLETLVTGKLFEDIKEAVEKMADPEKYDAIIVTNLCVPTASGLPLRLLPSRSTASDRWHRRSGFGIPTHAEAKDVLAGAMLKYAREEAIEGPSRTEGTIRQAVVTLLGEMFPADPVGIGHMLEPLGLAAGPSCRPANGASFILHSTVRRCGDFHPFYTASVREFEAAGRQVIGSAPVSKARPLGSKLSAGHRAQRRRGRLRARLDGPRHPRRASAMPVKKGQISACRI